MIIENNSNKDRIAVCTIAAKNYLPSVRVFVDSLTQYHPNIEIFTLLADKVDDYFKPDLEKFKLISIDDINNTEIQRMLFTYNVLEMCTALKPYLLLYLLKQYNFTKVIYFDSDIYVTSNLDEIWHILDEHPIILTPHLTEPIPTSDRCRPGEFEVMKSGTFNPGFIALRNTPDSIQFLEWWRERLSLYCIYDPNNGYFADQKWMDLAPGYFEKAYILRDLSYNAAFWNLQDRPIRMEGGQVLVGAKPLKFFHFSGFDPENINQISKHQDRFTLNRLPELKPIFKKYRDLLLTNDYLQTKNWPYAFNFFDNGVKIPEIARRMYWGLGEKVAKFGDPFNTQKSSSFFHWLNENVYKGESDRYISRFWHAIYLSRPDVQAAFPDIFEKNHQQFLDWVSNQGRLEFKVDLAFVKPTDTLASNNNIKHTTPRPMGSLWLKGWLRLKASGKKWVTKIFKRDSKYFRGLLLISKGIETMFLPEHAVVSLMNNSATPVVGIVTPPDSDNKNSDSNIDVSDATKTVPDSIKDQK